MNKQFDRSGALATAITKSASKQTYYTIRFFVDRNLVTHAYRAYGYFRWVDDVLDARSGTRAEKLFFARRQESLLESCYAGKIPEQLCAEEWMLVDLVCSDTKRNSGLQSYLRNMMDVMVFDATRAGQVISQASLSEYSRKLATAVTEAMYYFIGHKDPAPRQEARYLAVTGAHITHMLRDAIEDFESGYFNIPREYLHQHGITPRDLTTQAYREWVCGRVQLARNYFEDGKENIAQVRNLRCRLAGYAYIARFEWMLHVIEGDNYLLRSDYPERKSLWAAMWMGWSTLTSMLASLFKNIGPRSLAVQPVRIEKR